MTITEEENKAARLKQKLMNEGNTKEEARSFLSFSRGNLSISHSDLEHGFNKHRFRPRRNTILSTTALVLALLCLCLEIWTLYSSLSNAREIGNLKRDVENLKHRIIEEDLLDELKAFEEQLHADGVNDEEDYSDADIDNAEYDSNYDDASASHDYSEDDHTPTYGSRPSDFPHSSVTLEPVPSPPDPTPNTELLEKLYGLVERKDEGKHEENHEKRIHEGKKLIHEEKNTLDPRTKRSANERVTHVPGESSYRRGYRNQTRRTIVSRMRFHENVEDDPEESQTGPTNSERHPPKKYHAHVHPEMTHGHPSANQENPSGQFRASSTRLDEDDADDTRRFNWRDDYGSAREPTFENYRTSEIPESPSNETRRGMTRRHLRAPRQVYAVHYGADSALFSEEDEHTGNGRARHGDGIFKAWRPSDWVSELGMSKHFSLAADGRLTVHESGLYLVYAQIHYLDEHDENGFHLLVNGRPILQCMVYSPGVGHKSRSCFSAQVTMLHAGDVVILKDVVAARYTLFQRDKSFFGLVKIGDSRQPRHPAQQST